MHTAEQVQAAAEQMGFQNVELMLAYFKAKLLAEGLYEELNMRAAQSATKQ